MVMQNTLVIVSSHKLYRYNMTMHKETNIIVFNDVTAMHV